jgi:Transposase DDE domain
MRCSGISRPRAEGGHRTIVGATIINAPASTKNVNQARDPEMHQTRKGKQWYFGMKAHLGVDSRTKLIHAAVVAPANVADSTVLPNLLHGRETRVWVIRRIAVRRRSSAARPKGAGLHQSPLPPSWRSGCDRAGEEPHQVNPGAFYRFKSSWSGLG